MAERVRRSTEERIAEIDKKIATHKANIEALEAKKAAILNPKLRKSKASKLKAIMQKAKALDLTPEEIAQKLGIDLDDDN